MRTAFGARASFDCLRTHVLVRPVVSARALVIELHPDSFAAEADSCRGQRRRPHLNKRPINYARRVVYSPHPLISVSAGLRSLSEKSGEALRRRLSRHNVFVCSRAEQVRCSFRRLGFPRYDSYSRDSYDVTSSKGYLSSNVQSEKPLLALFDSVGRAATKNE